MPQTGSLTCIDPFMTGGIKGSGVELSEYGRRKFFLPRPIPPWMVREIDPTELARKLKTAPEKVVLLDVREPYERELAVIEPSLHIPMGEIPTRTDEIPRDRELIVYCHGGGRSLMVASFLEDQGFKPVENLAGGIDAWSVKVDRSVPRYS